MGDEGKEVRRTHDERKDRDRHEEKRIDTGVEDTFPASDPTAVGGATRIERDGEGGASEDGGGSDDTPGTETDDTSRTE